MVAKGIVERLYEYIEQFPYGLEEQIKETVKEADETLDKPTSTIVSLSAKADSVLKQSTESLSFEAERYLDKLKREIEETYFPPAELLERYREELARQRERTEEYLRELEGKFERERERTKREVSETVFRKLEELREEQKKNIWWLADWAEDLLKRFEFLKYEEEEWRLTIIEGIATTLAELTEEFVQKVIPKLAEIAGDFVTKFFEELKEIDIPRERVKEAFKDMQLAMKEATEEILKEYQV